MSNDYYAPSGTPAPFSWWRAEGLQSEFQAVAAGFAKLPPLAELVQERAGYLTDTGSGNAYAAAVSSPIAGYVAGQRFGILSNRLNTGPASLSINGLGARAIRRSDDTPLAAGDIGPIFEVVYSGTAFLLTVPARNAEGLQKGANLTDLTNPSAARAALGLGAVAMQNSIDLDLGDTHGILPVEQGGTGAGTVTAARAALGLGDLATLNAVNLATPDATGSLPMSRVSGRGALASQNSISLSGSQATGVLPQSKGGLGATTVSAQRAALGLGSMATESRVDYARQGESFVAENGTSDRPSYRFSADVNTGFYISLASDSRISHTRNGTLRYHFLDDDSLSQNIVNRGMGDERYVRTSSSLRFKDAVQPLGAPPDILSLEIKRWLWGGSLPMDDSRRGENGAGLIAEDVEAVAPDVVLRNDDGEPTGLDALALIGILVAHVKALRDRVDTLEGET